MTVAHPRPCSIANSLAVIGERWSLLALREVFFGVRRFDRIAANTGASRDILTTRLKKLVENGVLAKELYQAHPPRYEYTLTEAGLALHPVLLALKEWGDHYVTEGEAPTVFRHDCGAVLHPRTVCDACSQPVPPDSARAVRIGGVPQRSAADSPGAPSPTDT
ncbi:helix-turn-helix transcriptional regulator (plasmid) [Streptomyces sp. NBC_00257]|uniref:winged helix-turn-helix transcriptional regulator n=1 Tax=unclassified Streptomyces TaxID=2593676 RepID=UPI0022576972|nr:MULTISPECIES: helix-turn-helix domain-containing protein [unclassified Streptomyces]MCX5434022.1 helix-turn-helix transcriptional regulator [Streptomyces sp. NBC_00062]MCX5434488.1 helix-turn-helix transcriptional regulator [Streptomyces sp. NBC_00062]WTB60245.1 helix-turn-helix transcriptional regulator [Streptomyces sp. NBC_00826]WTB60558.1 helix-turn-helix transcriptional regulator [Streptomyces sp. NBC_00826]